MNPCESRICGYHAQLSCLQPVVIKLGSYSPGDSYFTSHRVAHDDRGSYDDPVASVLQAMHSWRQMVYLRVQPMIRIIMDQCKRMNYLLTAFPSILIMIAEKVKEFALIVSDVIL